MVDALTRLTAPRRSRVAAGVVVLGCLGVAGVAAALVPGTTASRCTDPHARLAGVWDPQVRVRVEQAIRGTEVAYAEDTWARLEPRLDAYTDAWAASELEVCESSEVGERDQALADARMRCVDGHLHEFRALVAVFEEPDAKVVRSAVRAALELPSAEGCSVDAVARYGEDEPADPATRARLDALRERLARINALDYAGRYEGLVERSAALSEDARAIGHRSTILAADKALSLALFRQGKRDESAEIAERAYFEAKALGSEFDATWFAMRMLFVRAHDQGRFDEAMTWAKHAEAEIELLHDPELRAVLDGRLGILHASRGDLDAAAPYFERAVAHYEQNPSSDPFDHSERITQVDRFLAALPEG